MLNKKDLGASDAEASHQDRHAARGAHNKDTRGSKPTRDALTEQRKRLRDTGFAPIPVAGKKPVPEEWQKKTTVTDTEIETWSGYNSTGLITRLMPALDVDIYNPEAAKAVEELVRERFEARGKLLVRIGNAPKYAIPFRTDKSFKKITANLTPPEDDPTAVYLQRGDSFRPTDQKIELLGDGQQLVAFGEHPDTRRPYRWIGGEPGEVRRDELPELTEAEARRLVDDVAQLLCDKFGYTRKQSARSEDATRAPNDKLAADDITELAAAVEAIPNDIPDWEDWNSIMMAIWAATGGSEEGFEIADRWCAKWEGYDANETRRRWEAISKSPPNRIGAGTIYHMANKASPEWRWRYEAEQMAKSLNMRREEEPPDTAPAYSEEALALLFAQRHAARRRYVSAWNKWFSFDGKQWTVDETRETWSLARKLCREASSGVNKLREAKSIANAKTRAAVVSLAGEDRRLAATVDQWDADPWLLNTPGGVIDLRTGERRDHRAEDYMTKITAVAPDASCPTPLLSKFLDRVTDGDKKLQAYLARVTGYSLTGVTTEHALFFLHGGGANGKGVFMNTIACVLGDYHRTAPIEVFTATNNEQHPTQLAMLRGARLVTATETEEGRRWAESRIKTLTGGDRIAARFMRQDFFEYTPQFKLMISGNHKPGLRSDDEAIRRRLNLVPFDVTIPEAERDKELTGKLKAEGPGVLAWMIAGCLEWQRVGLAPPKIVTEATDAYLEDEDTIKLWVDEVCLQGEQYWTATNQLFASWQDWAEARGEYVIPSRRFVQRLEALGFERHRPNQVRGFRGLGLTPFTAFAAQARPG
jgi:putative DNA primase/helicase